MLLRKVTEDTTLVHSQMAEKRDKAATNHVTTMSAQHHDRLSCIGDICWRIRFG